VWLLVGLTAYLGVSTVVTLPKPYSNPVFIIASVLLIASTGACSWERTGAAVRNARRQRSVDITRDVQALRNPSFSIEVPAGLSAEEARAAVHQALRSCRMKTYEREQLIGGDAHTLGNWGSTLFHWGLVGLFLFAGLGQLTRAEGVVNVVLGGSVQDVADSYTAGDPGALLFLGRYTGASIGVEKIDDDHFANGSARGVSPLVTVSDGGTVRESRWVFPNAPAHYKSLTIHREATGPALIVSLLFPGGQETTSVPVYFPTEAASATDRKATLHVSNTVSGKSYSVVISPKVGGRVVARIPGVDYESAPLGAGQAAALPDGTRLTVDALTSYAQLRVINDWSLRYVFGSFYLALLGIALSVFLPPRRVVSAFDPTGSRLDVRVGQRKNDPAFSLRVERALHTALRGSFDSEDSK